MNTLSNWAGNFGREYTDRNQYDPATRVEGFLQMLPADAHYILEVGSNYGNNLAALESIGREAIGIEPNEYAIQRGLELRRSIIPGTASRLPFAANSFDLVMTCGVLIHISPNMLAEAMAEMYRVSKKYILTIEYMGDDPTIENEDGMKEYRGLKDMLWKRKTYSWKEANLIGSGTLDGAWDNASWLLYQKV